MDSNVFAVGSADKGKHYCRLTRLHKQSFEALVRFKFIEILENLTPGDTFTTIIGKLKVDPSPH